MPVLVLLVGACALILFAFFSRRRRPVSDAVAKAIDVDAGSRGELRSANWFAARETRDAWADFHLARAAEHLQRINWSELYPAIRAPRAQIATAGLVIATLALTVTMPERVGVRPTASAAGVAPAKPSQGEIVGRMLDPELQKQLEALLAAAASGTLPTAETMVSDIEMREVLAKLSQLSDAELLAALQRALAANPDAKAESAVENMKRLAEQSRRAAEAGTLPKELQNALEKLSDELELAKFEDAATGEDASAAASGGQMGQTNGASDAEELSIQFAKEADAGGGAGTMMMSSPDGSQAGGPPGSGVGGAGSQESAAATATIEAALKQETVEASQDTPGANVESEIRRKTEHGSATVTFTGSASGQFDRSRAGAPPPVPEARRTGVQSYFVRKPR